MSKKVVITLSEDEAPLIEEYDGALQGRRKKVAFFELALLFADYLKQTYPLSSVPKLPKNVVGLRIYNQRIDYVIFVPAGIRPVIYHQEAFNVGFPNVLMLIGLQHNRVVESKMFAITEDSIDAITEETRLYHYPFSNVHYDGEICWGNFDLPKVKNTELDKIVRLFFALPSTDDLYNSGALKMSYREFLMKCVETPFDNSFLIPTNMTYEHLFKKGE